MRNKYLQENEPIFHALDSGIDERFGEKNDV